MRGPTELALIRHGHTAANGSPGGMRMSGWTDTALSDEGELEAARLARALRHDRGFTAIYTSPLQRARRTAEPICDALRIPVRVDPGLREIFCGQVDGRSVEDVRTHHPDAWARNAQESDEDFSWPGGETYRAFRARCLRSIRRIAARHPGERVLVVTHAGVISQLAGWIRGIGCARWSALRPGNASISTIRWGPRGRAVVRFDERGHLAEVAAARATWLPRAG
jgi:broad specificity phosphatase PhoE